MARAESRSRHSKEAAMGERIWTAKRTSLTHLERPITEENRAQIYSWHEQKTKERESGRRSFKIPCLKTRIDSLLEGAKKFYASRFYQLKIGHGAIGTFLEMIGAPESPLDAGGVATLSNQSCICTQSVENGGHHVRVLREKTN